ncbi:MAG: hypothetical protein FWE33_01625 [Defluviitaleaceae bacterium]|nr:hypothetical protein [Defluviitaleaceae bacterium]
MENIYGFDLLTNEVAEHFEEQDAVSAFAEFAAAAEIAQQLPQFAPTLPPLRPPQVPISPPNMRPPSQHLPPNPIRPMPPQSPAHPIPPQAPIRPLPPHNMPTVHPIRPINRPIMPHLPPPSTIPRHVPSLRGIGPSGIARCLHNNTYVWLRNRQEFWFYPVHIGRRSVAGYRHLRGSWVYMGFDLNMIDSFFCGGR